MYVCQICNKNPATVHLTDIHNNVKKELHMCEECAQKKGFALGQAMSFQQATGGFEPRGEEHHDLCCDRCGITWKEFRQRGRFGCAEDYGVFREHLQPLLSDIQAHRTHHCGKHPGKGQSDAHKEMFECRRKLREAIDREEYEEAARLRDRLGELENKQE